MNGLIFIFILSLQLVLAQDGLDTNSFSDDNTKNEAQTNDLNKNEDSDEVMVENTEEIRETSQTPEQSKEQLNQNNKFDNFEPDDQSFGIKNNLNGPVNDIGGYFPSYIYEERGRKDPFEPAIKQQQTETIITEIPDDITKEQVGEGLLKYEISALTLSAILIGKANKPKALVKDPTGLVYVIHENDRVGRNNGVVKRIRQGQIVIVESREQKDGERLYTTQVLSLGK